MATQNNEDIEKLLYKLIFQFSIYAVGSSPLLDPYLININKNLKRGINYQLLTPDLIALSSALTKLPKEAYQQSNKADNNHYFIKQLQKSLANTTVPVKFQEKYHLFQQQSEIKTFTEEEIQHNFDLGISLLIDINKHSVSKQNDFENFLTHFSEQFVKLESHVFDASSSNELSIQNNFSLSSTINTSVNSIKISSNNAKTLPALQDTITQHLNELTSQCNKLQTSENLQLITAQKQLASLSEKIQNLEDEADSLRENLKTANNLAQNDALTGLPNRMSYDDRVIIEYNRWLRYKTPLALIVWDIDLFKVINDTYGHKAGDKTLALVAQLLSSNSRNTDFVARYGGEEFVMLLPSTTAKQALITAEKIRSAISSSRFNYQGEMIKLTISCGISEFTQGDQPGNVFDQADQALYLSKEQGRNQCSIFNKQ